ncbi:hypothetical protein VNO80_19477 [Phaseolus coccineus]|uniref:Uncharacterized protein n=1 Tax=Phaseolus coccineus TaxID=3886 RepID=A0AAN9R099_PHACN
MTLKRPLGPSGPREQERNLGLDDDSGELVIDKERVRRVTDYVGIVVTKPVGECALLGGLIDGVRLEDKATLGEASAIDKVVKHNLHLLLAISTG